MNWHQLRFRTPHYQRSSKRLQKVVAKKSTLKLINKNLQIHSLSSYAPQLQMLELTPSLASVTMHLLDRIAPKKLTHSNSREKHIPHDLNNPRQSTTYSFTCNRSGFPLRWTHISVLTSFQVRSLQKILSSKVCHRPCPLIPMRQSSNL